MRRFALVCAAAWTAAGSARAESLIGSWQCEVQSPKGPYTIRLRIANTAAYFMRDGIPRPISWIGAEAKFEWVTKDGRTITAVVSPRGGQSAIRLGGRHNVRPAKSSPAKGRPLVLEEFVHVGSCEKRAAQ